MTFGRMYLPVFVATMAIPWCAVVVVPYVQLGKLEPIQIEETGADYPTVRPAEALIGADVYRSLGCQYCHTRQVRSMTTGSDIVRGWGTRRTVARDYIRDSPVMLGTVRVGPDLTNIGCRQTNSAYFFQKLYRPTQTIPNSVMPSYERLFEKGRLPQMAAGPKPTAQSSSLVFDDGTRIIPGTEVRALVAFLMSLKADELFLEVYPRTAVADEVQETKPAIDGKGPLESNKLNPGGGLSQH